MKKFLTLITILSILSSTFHAQDTEKEKVLEQINKLSKAWTLLPKTLDGDAILNLYSKDLTGSYVQIDETTAKRFGTKHDNYYTYSVLKSDISKATNDMALNNYGVLSTLWNINLEEDIEISGDLAIAKSSETFKVSYNGNIVRNAQRHTVYVFKKEGENWMILQTHKVDNLFDSDYCFPANSLISIVGGSQKSLSEINVGDTVLSINNRQLTYDVVKEVQKHELPEIALQSITVITPDALLSSTNNALGLTTVDATPNHPLTVEGKIMTFNDVCVGDHVTFLSPEQEIKETIVVDVKKDKTTRTVYNLVLTNSDNYFVNGLSVLTK